jgi:hypothetical protein
MHLVFLVLQPNYCALKVFNCTQVFYTPMLLWFKFQVLEFDGLFGFWVEWWMTGMMTI